MRAFAGENTTEIGEMQRIAATAYRFCAPAMSCTDPAPCRKCRTSSGKLKVLPTVSSHGLWFVFAVPIVLAKFVLSRSSLCRAVSCRNRNEIHVVFCAWKHLTVAQRNPIWVFAPWMLCHLILGSPFVPTFVQWKFLLLSAGTLEGKQPRFRWREFLSLWQRVRLLFWQVSASFKMKGRVLHQTFQPWTGSYPL